MQELLKIGLPALVALVGTILTVIVGYRQWKKQQEASRQANFQQEKQQAYKTLWEMLEEVHVNLRTKESGQAKFRGMLTEVNSFILRKSIYLDADVHEWSNDYLKCVRDLKEFIASSGNDAAEASFRNTEALPPSVMERAKDLAILQQRATDARDRILNRCRSVLKGTET